MILYSTGCPQCRVLIQKLNIKNMKYDIINDIEKIKEKGFLSVPILELDDGTLLKFSDANAWINSQR